MFCFIINKFEFLSLLGLKTCLFELTDCAEHLLQRLTKTLQILFSIRRFPFKTLACWADHLFTNLASHSSENLFLVEQNLQQLWILFGNMQNHNRAQSWREFARCLQRPALFRRRLLLFVNVELHCKQPRCTNYNIIHHCCFSQVNKRLASPFISFLCLHTGRQPASPSTVLVIWLHFYFLTRMIWFWGKKLETFVKINCICKKVCVRYRFILCVFVVVF